MDNWYKLDNAAKIFPTITSDKNSSVFRVSAVLTEAADGEVLQKTVDYVYSRFPMIFAKMRKGVFWNYFDANLDEFFIQEEKAPPCGVINPFENNGYLLRVLYYGKRVSLEVFHALTDGVGAIELLKTILFYYFSFLDGVGLDCAHMTDSEGKIILVKDGVSDDDVEDSFYKHYTPEKRKSVKAVKSGKAFRIRGTSFIEGGNNIITCVMSASELNKLAKSKNATITSYLASLLIFSIYSERQKYSADKNPIIISVPVNLRKLFPSKTLRNFAAVVKVGMTVGSDTTLEDIIESITKQLKEKTEKPALQKLIEENVRLEKAIYSRFVPLFIKNLIVRIGFKILYENQKTITLTNIGNVAVPKEMSKRLELIETLIFSTAKSPVGCGVCSVGDSLTISFTRSVSETDFIRHFIKYLSETGGLDIAVYSNDWGK